MKKSNLLEKCSLVEDREYGFRFRNELSFVRVFICITDVVQTMIMCVSVQDVAQCSRTLSGVGGVE